MIRLYLLAEGQTEQVFAGKLLQPHLAHFEVFLHNPMLIAHARRRGVTHRGGGRKYIPMRNDILRLLEQDKAKTAFFTTMIDLYGLPMDFPRHEEALKYRDNPDFRVNLLENAFLEDIGDPRFIPYVQMHEFEAYLFSDPLAFKCFYGDANKEITALLDIANSAQTPEHINDDPSTAPSKRILQIFPDYADWKTTVGPRVATQIGLSTIREKCPHFHQWLSRLEGLRDTSVPAEQNS